LHWRIASSWNGLIHQRCFPNRACLKLIKAKFLPPFGIRHIFFINDFCHCFIIENMTNFRRDISDPDDFMLCNPHFHISWNVSPLVCLMHVNDVLNVDFSIFTSDPLLFNLEFFFSNYHFVRMGLVWFLVHQTSIKAVVSLFKSKTLNHR